ncbi:hypothetical protein HPB50_015352 [Hyalomma asiaticum]|uniref:Uncharacterized protein n=1 Tax=Hyalomma asiaticum TaxID=266040 RepID=A0ACB7T2T7_HYAAI|nr:hypothetical protein HPB50_015352 [Hyalomma asiaticum]
MHTRAQRRFEPSPPARLGRVVLGVHRRLFSEPPDVLAEKARRDFQEGVLRLQRLHLGRERVYYLGLDGRNPILHSTAARQDSITRTICLRLNPLSDWHASMGVRGSMTPRRGTVCSSSLAPPVTELSDNEGWVTRSFEIEASEADAASS